MKISQGTKDFAEAFYQRAYGFSLKKMKRFMAAKEAAGERKIAALREAAAREAAARELTIVRLHKEPGIAPRDIARTP